MLTELFLYATTPCSPYVLHMGYLYEVIAIRSRHQRCAMAWQGHLDQSRQAVVSALGAMTSGRKAVVFGSGILLDLPFQLMAQTFEELVLVDLVHLRSIRRRMRSWKNVRLVTADVTGLAEKLYLNCKRGVKDLPEPTTLLPEVDERTDLVVSLNILSQLPVLPAQYAQTKMLLPPAELSAWKERIMQSHYQALARLSCPVCLIYDYEEEKRDRKGLILESVSTIGALKIPTGESTWLWEMAPPGESAPGFSRFRAVTALFMNSSRRDQGQNGPVLP